MAFRKTNREGKPGVVQKFNTPHIYVYFERGSALEFSEYLIESFENDQGETAADVNSGLIATPFENGGDDAVTFDVFMKKASTQYDTRAWDPASAEPYHEVGFPAIEDEETSQIFEELSNCDEAPKNTYNWGSMSVTHEAGWVNGSLTFTHHLRDKPTVVTGCEFHNMAELFVIPTDFGKFSWNDLTIKKDNWNYGFNPFIAEKRNVD